MSELKLTRSCGTCEGTQEMPNPNTAVGGVVACTSCEDGTVIIGTIDTTDLENKIDDIKDKVDDIKGVVDEL